MNNYPWQTTWGEYVVKLSNRGVCLTKAGEKPKLICSGTFSRGVVIPDTDFLVCEEAVKGWAKPRKMVVIDLMTETKKDAPFPESDKVTPLLILNGKLLFSCSNEAEKKHTYYFYDVVNDTIEEVEGDFSCLGSSVGEGRFLQKTSMENKYFTMQQNFSIGIFDTETYKYTELVKVPFLLFSNEDFWIDENEGKIYMVTDGNLISYPIEVDFSIADDMRVSLNGKKLQFDVAPYIRNGRTMVPMRAIFEALGAEVSWDNETRTAIGVKGGVEVKITIGENVLYKNGEAIELDCVAEITNDRTMVPARAISEAFGYIVEWDNETKTVNILDPYKRKYYTYDEKGQVASISSNLWTSDVVFYSYLYDESGRVIRVWERPMIKNSDRLFEYTYNEKGQVTAKGTCKDWWMDVLRGATIDKEVSFTEVEKYFYNDEGQLIYAEYPTGGRRYYIYEEGKLIREENDKGEVVKKYVYDENGRIYYTESY